MKQPVKRIPSEQRLREALLWGLAIFAIGVLLIPADPVLAAAFDDAAGGARWEVIWTVLSDAGTRWVTMGLVLFLVAFRPRESRWRDAGALAISTSLGAIAVETLKRVVGRARPFAFDSVNFFQPFNADGHFHAFPSGHAANVASIAVVLAVLWPRWRHLFFAYAAAMSLSRVGLSKHFFGDIVAGFAIGYAAGHLAAYWMRAGGYSWRVESGEWRVEAGDCQGGPTKLGQGKRRGSEETKKRRIFHRFFTSLLLPLLPRTSPPRLDEALVLAAVIFVSGALLIPQDPALLSAVRVGADHPIIPKTDQYLSYLGTGYVTLAVAVCLYLFRPAATRKREFWAVALAFASGSLMNEIIKIIVGRGRPMEVGVVNEFIPFTWDQGHHSFPSGHAMTAAATAVVLALIWPKTRYFVFALAIAVWAGRVLEARHFLGDCVSGFAAGYAVAHFFCWRLKVGRYAEDALHPTGTRPADGDAVKQSRWSDQRTY